MARMFSFWLLLAALWCLGCSDSSPAPSAGDAAKAAPLETPSSSSVQPSPPPP